ncbi:MAG: CoA transferase [Gammaproteobacteria bacterium]|nr:CoA transferase [Gammaproteobacteria bacterium]
MTSTHNENPTQDAAQSEMLFDGLTVLDVASFIAGPTAATIMGDFGARVIKIEPPEGDTFRASPDAAGNPPYEERYSWLVDNRNKRGIVLDLKQEAGHAALMRLATQADVFVTNYPFPVRERLGIEYEDVKAHNPTLIYASLTAYGETGPEARSTGFDSTALWARTGLMDMVRPFPEAPPARSLPGMGDHPTGVALFGAIAAALYRRERTGRGSYVSSSLMANGLWWNAFQAQAMLCGTEFERRPGREAATNALHNLYVAADGRWFHLVLIPEERRWPTFVQAIERPELAADPRFATASERHVNAKALIGILDQVFASKPWSAWKPIFESNVITYGLVGQLADIPGDEQMLASDAITPIDDERVKAKYLVNSPLWIADTPKRAPMAAPTLGEHTDEVLREMGFSAAEIQSLADSGVTTMKQ